MGLRARFTAPTRFPDALRTELQAQDAWLLEERLSGTVTYRNYRAPGMRATLDKRRARVCVAATGTRVVVWTQGRAEIDLPPGSPDLTVTLDRPERLCLAYDAERFSTDRSGRVEIRFTTPNATRLADWLRHAPA